MLNVDDGVVAQMRVSYTDIWKAAQMVQMFGFKDGIEDNLVLGVEDGVEAGFVDGVEDVFVEGSIIRYSTS